ncbi:MAG: hypothetical protein KAW41_03950 [Candidatus Diapherotrites archaeon]|nr:hypothetical protein [Candidatus Diapherotrites archaeon]
MKIHTLDVLPRQVRTKAGKKRLLVLKEGSISSLLPIKLRILRLLSKKALKTTQVTELLGIQKRTTRKFLNELEIEEKIVRTEGNRINNSFRFADSWRIVGKISGIPNKPPKDRVCVWYSTKHTNYSTRHYCFLPKEIGLTDNIASAIGIFDGEGSKTKITTLEIVNNEPLVIKCLLEFFGIFGIRKKDWKWRLTFNIKLKDKLSVKAIKKAREYWVKSTKISAENETASSPQFLGTRIGKIRRGPPWGALSIFYNSVILRSVLASIMENLKPMILQDPQLVAGYLRGYLAAEAYVGANDRAIQTASTRKEELAYLGKCFDVIGVKASMSKATSTSPPRIIVTNFDSFMKLYKLDVFRLHPYKKANLLSKLLNYTLLTGDDKEKIGKELKTLNNKIENREKPFKKFTYTKTYLARAGG